MTGTTGGALCFPLEGTRKVSGDNSRHLPVGKRKPVFSPLEMEQLFEGWDEFEKA